MKTKLTIIIISLLVMIGVVGTIWGAEIAEAATGIWNSCPRGETNCRYPGKCNLYIDTNNDRICDRSQPAPVTTTPAATAKATTPVITSSPAPTTTTKVNPTITRDGVLAAELPQNPTNSPTPLISEPESAIVESAPLKLKNSYYFVPIFLVMGILYALTWTMSARKIIKNLLHRKIWNVVLLVSMLVSALLGLFLILAIDFNINITLPFNMLFWHVEAGIALGIIGIFHIFWHWRYFAKMVKATA